MIPEIETQRCTLVPIQKDHEAMIFRLYANHEVRAFLGGVIDPMHFMDKFQKMLSEKHELHWSVFLKANSEFVGLISIDEYHDTLHDELSYQFLPAYWGEGLARETIQAALKAASEIFELDNILAETQSKNKRSIHLLQSLGMKEIQRLVRHGAEQSVFEYSRKSS